MENCKYCFYLCNHICFAQTNRHTMRKLRSICSLVLLLLVSAFYNPAGAQAVIFGESFEPNQFLPTGWSQVSASINRWSRVSNSTNPTISLAKYGIEFAKFTARGVPAGTIQTIALPVADLRKRGSNNAFVRFYMYRDSLSKNGDSIGVYVSTSASLNGATWLGTVARYSRLSVPDTQIINDWYPYTFNIPSSFNGATNYIMIKAIGQAGNNMYLDSFYWITYPIECTGKPTGTYITSNPGIICGGSGASTLTLNGAVATYTGIGLTWQWSANPTGPWTTLANTTVSIPTGNLTTTRYYRCILNCSLSSESDTTNVYSMRVVSTAKPVITVSPANPSYCAGGAPTLLVAKGAKYYSWSPSTGLDKSNKDSVMASPSASTTYTISGSDTAGCTGTLNVTVTLRQPPTVTINAADSMVCEGDSLRLAAQGFGISTVVWSPNGETTNAIYAKPTVNTKYTVTAKSAFGCSTMVSKNLYVKQHPVAKFGYTKNGNTFHFADSSQNASGLHWLFGDGNESYKNNPVYTFSSDTAFSVWLIASDPPCANDTDRVTIDLNPAGVYKNAAPSISIFPNPVGSVLHIKLPDGIKMQNIKLYDLAGNLLKEWNNPTQANQLLALDIKDLATGSYIVQCYCNKQMHPFFIQKTESGN